eukprot:TRINITY_DN58708_c0_g1_i1.p1 TRINITY_DN58708_c0_g1~~TRINITY_DN58708_c0_g1_i1.p1  ORF type:complete len:201 (-),score=26.24 TRINITY_DN58708_c0_g1_i1:271-873(-)
MAHYHADATLLPYSCFQTDDSIFMSDGYLQTGGYLRTDAFAPPQGTSGGRRSRARSRRFPEDEVSATGRYCSVRKHARLGCAVVHFETESLRDAVMHLFQRRGEQEIAKWQRSDLEVTVQHHFDKARNKFDRRALYVHWGLPGERLAPIPVQYITQSFDNIAFEVESAQTLAQQAPTAEQVPRSRFFGTQAMFAGGGHVQ